MEMKSTYVLRHDVQYVRAHGNALSPQTRVVAAVRHNDFQSAYNRDTEGRVTYAPHDSDQWKLQVEVEL